MGAEKFVKWEKFENLKEAIEKLKNHFIIGIEQDKKAVDYRKIKKLMSSPVKSVKADHGISGQNPALIFGNEVDGLSKEDLKLCDIVAELPMRGFMVRQAHHPSNIKQGKESLNVAVAAGIVLYSLL